MSGMAGFGWVDFELGRVIFGPVVIKSARIKGGESAIGCRIRRTAPESGLHYLSRRMHAMNKRVSIIVHGRVQGVAFRHHTVQRALELGVFGWVRNLPDGTVEGLIEGDATAVDAMVAWCRQGPPAARVEGVELREEAYGGGFDDFGIRY
jgi:acylphosphatase